MGLAVINRAAACAQPEGEDCKNSTELMLSHPRWSEFAGRGVRPLEGAKCGVYIAEFFDDLSNQRHPPDFGEETMLAGDFDCSWLIVLVIKW